MRGGPSNPRLSSAFLSGLSFPMILLLLLLFFTHGCIVIPTSEDKVLWGRRISSAQLASLRSGMTKADVVAQLGEPDVIWEDENLYAYNWDVRRAVLIVKGQGAANIPKRCVLLAQFNSRERLARFERTVNNFGSFGAHLKQWTADSAGQLAGQFASASRPGDSSEQPQELKPSVGRNETTTVLVRITGKMEGKDFAPFADGLTLDTEIGLALASFMTGCLFRSIGGPDVLSREASRKGWGCLRLEPGTYYLGVQTARRVVGLDREWRFAQAERFRFDVPLAAKTIYIGSLHIRCLKADYSLKKPQADRFEQNGLSVRNEVPSADLVAMAEHLGPVVTVLMKRETGRTFRYRTLK